MHFRKRALVCIWDAAASSSGPISLDFAGMSSVIVQRGGSYLEWDNVVLRGFASKHVNASLYPHYRVRQLGGWPSITADPGAQVHAAVHSPGLCIHACQPCAPLTTVKVPPAHSGAVLSLCHVCMHYRVLLLVCAHASQVLSS
jgi:hypothetical protein